MSATAFDRKHSTVTALTLLSIHVAIALFFVLSQSCGTDATATGFPLDDAWIHLVYAQSIATTGLPAYNAGQVEAGFTSPLWLILLTLCELLSLASGLSPVVFVKALGVVAAWLTSYGVYRILRNFDVGQTVAFAVAALSALTPLLAFAQISGMEVSLASALVVWSVVAYQREQWSRLGWCLAGALLTRPELAILTPIFVVATLPKLKTSVRLATILRVTVPVVASGLAWVAFCLAATGRPLPNTFYAKFKSESWFDSLASVLGGIWAMQPLFLSIIGLILFVIGAYWLLRRFRNEALIILGTIALFTLAVAATREMIPDCGVYFYWSRYLAPVLPLATIPVGLGIVAVGSLFSARRNWAETIAIVALAGPALFFSIQGLQRENLQFCWNCQNINEVQVEFGKWIDRNAPASTTVLVNDAGAIRYFGRRRTVDLLALNDHRFLDDLKLHERIVTDAAHLAEFMQQEGADYLIVFPSWFPDLINGSEFPKRFSLARELRSEHYTICRAPQDLMIAFFRNRNETIAPNVR